MNKKLKRRKIQEDRLREFEGQEGGDHYEEKKIGDEWWVKSFNGGTDLWQVSIFSEKSFKAYKAFSVNNSYNKSEFSYRVNKEDDINCSNDMVDGNGDLIEFNEE